MMPLHIKTRRQYVLYYLLLAVTLASTCLAQDTYRCYSLRTVFPNCTCEAAMNEAGQSTLDAVVDCSNKRFNSVPAPNGTYTDIIYELRLNGNSITSLPDNAFHGLRITKIDLTGNSLTSVADNAFANTDELKILYIDGDSTSPPPKEALRRLLQLEELIIRNFYVQHLDGTNEQAYFLSMSNLKSLTLDNWGIVSIEPGSFLGPTNLLSLALINQEMRTLPINELSPTQAHILNLQKLKISGTKIELLTQYAFQALNQLSELDLSDNHINQLEENCFNGIGDTLQKLVLSGNLLRSGFSDLTRLANLPNLLELDLSKNENINTVPALTELGPTKPLVLDLSNNKITQLQIDAFVAIGEHVHTIRLEGNSINTIDDNSFNRVNNLHVLDLSTQKGTNPLSVSSSLIQSAATLQKLDLSAQGVNANSLWPVVSQLTALTYLNLDSTELRSIPDLVLQNLVHLEELSLEYNQLQQVTQQTLVGPKDTLSRLYLGGNSITTMAPCTFYKYTSFPITMTMQINPLACDCQIKWLWDYVKNGNIVFLTTDAEPRCRDGTLLSDLPVSSFSSCPTSPQCVEYTTPAPPSVTTTPAPTLNLVIDASTTDSIKVSWSLSNQDDLEKYSLRVSNSYGDSGSNQENILSSITSTTIGRLRRDTPYQVCIVAYFHTKKSISDCAQARTMGDGSSTEGQKGDGSENVGIIIGAVVGAVVLVCILGAIAYLTVIRKRPKKPANNGVPVQPRTFSKPELPSMRPDTRTFAKPKRASGGAGGGNDQHDGMQVVAISDGQTGNLRGGRVGSRVGRAERLTSDGGGYKTMSANDNLAYENDHGALPPTPRSNPSSPRDKQPGYYNMGFRDDKYDEIDGRGQREIMM